MGTTTEIQKPDLVALPTEGVDRNVQLAACPQPTRPVALPTEGVDRNISRRLAAIASAGRPPHGGRG